MPMLYFLSYCTYCNLGLGRLAFMHCIGSSICFWVNTIKEETIDSLIEKLTKGSSTACQEENSVNAAVAGKESKP